MPSGMGYDEFMKVNANNWQWNQDLATYLMAMAKEHDSQMHKDGMITEKTDIRVQMLIEQQSP